MNWLSHVGSALKVDCKLKGCLKGGIILLPSTRSFFAMRDNFSAKIIRDLERRVNGRCSNPDHRVPTSGPSGAHEDSVNIGVAAHICAAAPGGPRYDPGMTRAERSSIANGIWLCQNCAGLIDRDIHTYTVAVLKQWRRSAELRAKEELGQIPISREQYDAMHSVVFASSPKLGASDPVATMCRLTAESLERKDPRFKVEVERTLNNTTYTYWARENVACSLSVTGDSAAEFSEKISLLLRHGQELKMASSAITLEGSPLFDNFLGNDGVFVMAPANRCSASVLIELVNDENGRSFFAEVIGEIRPGTESINFQGKGLNGLFFLELTLPRNSTQVRVNTTIDFTVWDKMEISKLPNFARIWSYYECVRAGRSIKLSVEIGGNHSADLEGNIPNAEINNFALLEYVRNAKIISAALGCSIQFASAAKIPWDDFNAVNDLRQRLELAAPKDLQSNASMTLSPPPGAGIKHVLQYISSTVGLLRLEQEWDALALFDQTLPAFKLVTNFSNARLRQVGHPRKGSVTAEIVPVNPCKLSCSLQKLS
jgi:hypothetical protein